MVDMVVGIPFDEVKPTITKLFDSYSTYNSPHGFSLKYPTGWFVDDEIWKDDYYIEYVYFLPEKDDYINFIMVAIHQADYDYRGISSSEYMSKLNSYLSDGCDDITYSDNGYICYNFENKASEVLTDSI